jgi:hypothetical protein
MLLRLCNKRMFSSGIQRSKRSAKSSSSHDQPAVTTSETTNSETANSKNSNNHLNLLLFELEKERETTSLLQSQLDKAKDIVFGNEARLNLFMTQKEQEIQQLKDHLANLQASSASSQAAADAEELLDLQEEITFQKTETKKFQDQYRDLQITLQHQRETMEREIAESKQHKSWNQLMIAAGSVLTTWILLHSKKLLDRKEQIILEAERDREIKDKELLWTQKLEDSRNEIIRLRELQQHQQQQQQQSQRKFIFW